MLKLLLLVAVVVMDLVVVAVVASSMRVMSPYHQQVVQETMEHILL
jgi:hypothetical protein